MSVVQFLSQSRDEYLYGNMNQMLCSDANPGIFGAQCAGQTTYDYNARGDLIAVNDLSNALNNVSYAWDARDRLSGATVGAQTVQFQYDDGGHRIQQTAGAQTTNYLWDQFSPYGDVIQESDGTGAPTVNYVLGDTELLTQTRGTTTNYYLHDGQNSVRTLTDVMGSVTDSYLYDAYGNTRAKTGTTVNWYQYTGEQLDSAIGLYSLRARYYNTWVGNFSSRDPFTSNLIDPNQINLYSYSANNPINRYDPSGQVLEYSLAGGGSLLRGPLLTPLGVTVATYLVSVFIIIELYQIIVQFSKQSKGRVPNNSAANRAARYAAAAAIQEIVNLLRECGAPEEEIQQLSEELQQEVQTILEPEVTGQNYDKNDIIDEIAGFLNTKRSVQRLQSKYCK